MRPHAMPETGTRCTQKGKEGHDDVGRHAVPNLHVAAPVLMTNPQGYLPTYLPASCNGCLKRAKCHFQ